MSVQSPLTTLGTTPSSTSFYTTQSGSPATEEGDAVTATNATSPADPECDGARYRDARPLPRELKEHCQIYLEEQMYLAALHMLDILLCSGQSRRRGSGKPAFVPPPAQIALLGTLAVHPIHTTRSPDKTQLQVSSQALSYLRNLLNTVGPVNGNLRAAFDFPASSRGRRGWDGPGMVDDKDADLYEVEFGEGALAESRVGGQNGVWRRVQDFWSIVGWAFNCSVLHPHRWVYWKAWLEFMCDVLEADWEERARLDKVAVTGSPGEESDHGHLHESLLMAYASQGGRSSSGLKPVMRALCADGSQSSRGLFQEVFERETRCLSQSLQNKRKRSMLDLANDKFGDYYDDDDDGAALVPSSQDGSEPPTPQKHPPRRANGVAAASAVADGMIESVPLRLRLFSLLSDLSLKFPTAFAELGDVYETFARSVKALPVEMFALFVSSQMPGLSPITRIPVLRDLADPLRPRNAPSAEKVDHATDQQDGLSVAILEKCYLPFAANTISVEDNAKFSLVLESMFYILFTHVSLIWTPSLEKAVRHGVQAREDKVKKKKIAAPRGEDPERAAREVLAQSGKRLLILVEALDRA